MITGFRKPKRSGNIRKKIVAEHEEDAEASAKRESPPVESELVSTAAEKEKTRAKDKTKKSSKSGLLSFEDDLDSGDVFQVKKSKESKRLAQKLEHEKRYKQKLKDLPEVTKVAQEMAVEQGHSQTGSPANSYNSGSETSFSTTFSGKPCDDGDDTLQSDDSLPPIKMELNAGLIPDAATIFAVKKRREQARQLNVMGDFVPVVTKETTKYEGRFTNSKSRLIREEDEDDSDEDRMEFKGSSTKSFPALERRSQVAKALEEAQDEERNTDEEEDEVALWEKEQIKKGTGIPAAQSETAYGPQIPPDYVGQVQCEVPIITSEQYFTAISQQTSLGAGNILGVSSYHAAPQTVSATILPNFSSGSFVTVDMVAQRLSERLTSLTQVHRAHELEKEKIQNDLNSSTKNITTLETSSSELSDRFTFYQDIQGYFQDFSECINEKIPKINECEKLIHLLWRVRAEKFSQRRADDVKDQDSEILGKSSKQSSGKDEFGRDRGAFEENARKRRIAEREGRRNRRRRHREKTMPSEELMSYHEGLSSDDEELDSDVLRFEKDKEKVLSQAKDIFEDVIEDFSSVSEVQARFIQWRLGFQDSYKDAYADLSLPKVLDPFIRLELLSWNPLERDAMAIDDMQWYRTLTKFGDFKQKSKEEEEEHLKRTSLVVEKVLLAKIAVFVESVWDPLSSKQTEVVTSCINGILKRHTIDESSKQKKNLMNVVIARLRQVSENGMFLPLYPKGIMENKTSGALEFLRRQFWSSYKLLKNTLCWLGMLPESDLQDITVDGILNRYLIAALQQFPSLHENSELCRTIISLFPKSWFERADDTMLPGLQPFSRYLSGLAGSIYKSSLGYSSSEKKKAKLATKRIISLLMHMHAFDVARSVALDYKYDVS